MKKKRSDSLEKYYGRDDFEIMGDCNAKQIRGLIREHDHDIYLDELEVRLNERFENIQAQVGRYGSGQLGNPQRIM